MYDEQSSSFETTSSVRQKSYFSIIFLLRRARDNANALGLQYVCIELANGDKLCDPDFAKYFV